MPRKERNGIRASLELAAARPLGDRYRLLRYVTGRTSRSERAVRNLQGICDEYLKGRYDLEVIDIYQQPVLAKGERLVKPDSTRVGTYILFGPAEVATGVVDVALAGADLGRLPRFGPAVHGEAFVDRGDRRAG